MSIYLPASFFLFLSFIYLALMFLRHLGVKEEEVLAVDLSLSSPGITAKLEKMLAFNQRFWVSSAALLIMGFSVYSFPGTLLSDSIFNSQVHTGRNLLQAKKGCSVNFEFLNYTVITSKCKGPQYPPSICCGAFKEFACPYADVLNDLTNDCASTMFSYINLYGKYPPGLFASECREGKQGLACPASPPSISANDTGSVIMHYPSLLLIFAVGFLILLFQ